MTRHPKNARTLLCLLVALAVYVVDFEPIDLAGVVTGRILPEAEARIGRPWTPLSYAGVARRTTRRVIRRSAIYVSVLPSNCATTYVENVSIYQCGGSYYQPYGNQYVIVYID